MYCDYYSERKDNTVFKKVCKRIRCHGVTFYFWFCWKNDQFPQYFLQLYNQIWKWNSKLVFCLTFYIISLYMASQKGNKIKILSANCRGIQSKEKRYDVINYMKSKIPDILCLQDTHLIPEEEFNLKTIWDGEVILHGMRTNSRGVAILLNNTFEYTIKKVDKYPTGNMIALDLTLSDITVKLINIYCPNVDDTNFYNTINSILNENEQEYVIWCGDFNMTLNPQLDSFLIIQI